MLIDANVGYFRRSRHSNDSTIPADTTSCMVDPTSCIRSAVESCQLLVWRHWKYCKLSDKAFHVFATEDIDAWIRSLAPSVSIPECALVTWSVASSKDYTKKDSVRGRQAEAHAGSVPLWWIWFAFFILANSAHGTAWGSILTWCVPSMRRMVRAWYRG